MSKARELSQRAGVDGALSNRNLIINGAMQVAQRGTSASGLTSSYWSYPCVDRIKVFNNTSTVSASQETDAPTGFAYSFKLSLDAVAAPTGSEKIMIRVSPIEGESRLMSTIGNPLTLSFWVKSNKVGSFSCDVVNHDNQRNCQVVYTVDQANTWEYKTGTIYSASDDTFDMDAGLSLSVDFMCAYGPDLTSGSPQSTMVTRADANAAAGATTALSATNDYLQITGVQLEVGDTATPFEHRSIGQELALCQRYYCNSYNDTPYHPGFVFNNNQVSCNVLSYPVPMRAIPSFSTVSPYHVNSGNWGIYYATNGWSSTGYGPNYSSATTQHVHVQFSGVGGVTNGYTYICNGGFIMDAEL